MKYKVRIKGTDIEKDIKASNSLEAGVKYCEGQGFNYRVFANKLEVEAPRREKNKMTIEKDFDLLPEQAIEIREKLNRKVDKH